MQIWPAFMNLPAKMRFTATGMLAPGRMTVGDFPPSSRVHGVRFSAAARATTLATAPLPVYKMWSHRNLSSAVDSSTPPTTTLMASLSRYCGRSSARTFSECEATSEGFSKTQFPAAIAAIMPPIDKFKGKFHGEMTKTTPFGSRITSDLAGCWSRGVPTLSRFIQVDKCFNMWSISATLTDTSPMTASNLGRPRSATTAAVISGARSTASRRIASS
mmetsp:Transcript_92012/g.297706  ORF Transcript_92012/g.297706 Transcript_92012/m.297706 type:complete len:217 (+) Transcript_92012:831-1481(+)